LTRRAGLPKEARHEVNIPAFRNEPVWSYADASVRERALQALAQVRSERNRPIPLRIDGRPRLHDLKEVRNPSSPEEVLAHVAQANDEDARDALESASRHFADWRRMPVRERAMILMRAAQAMRRRRLLLVATEVLEAGKTWPEADADVAEAIDFLEYYARQMLRLSQGVEVEQAPGEYDEAFYVPLGVGVILPPWNFPLAILTGMTSAALVTGNTVVLKPASPTPLTAWRFVEAMDEAGLPPQVLQFLPGPGSRIGDVLVQDARTRFVSFTGSREVGLRIHQLSAQVQPGQRWIKKVVAEMGGKDAIVVDGTADLEAAAEAIVVSAFGFQGQKCSACSRAIFTADVYDEMLERVVERTKRLRLGAAESFDTDVGPVINASAQEKILGYIREGPREGARLVVGGQAREGGYYVEPTIFAEVPEDSRLAQEEIFGPVLSVLRARDFGDALRIANHTEYGLTGSVFSRDRRHLAQAREEFEVGNLYFNRKCTGALVGVHPFGGFNMSGTDSKTGSPDYLLLFLQMKAVGERL
jgi:1-pyrroline-5-carboxylate dehydrogenase